MSDLKVSLSPHIQSGRSVSSIMWWVNIALLPALVFSVYLFGLRALLVILVSLVTSVTVEALAQVILKQKIRIHDGSAVITALLFAFNLPATAPLPYVAVGAAVAIGVGKWVFGGLGQNPFNPALVGRAFMLVSFPAAMVSWMVPSSPGLWDLGVDVVTAATPLGIIGESSAPFSQVIDQLPSLTDLFLGFRGGSLGEVSALAILLGGLLLISLKIIPWQVPAATFGGLFVTAGIIWLIDPQQAILPHYHLFMGGSFLASFFMVTDMTTTPMTLPGRMLFGFCSAGLAVLIRVFGNMPEGFSYAILFMNALVPLIDRGIKPRRFGHQKEREVQNG